MTTVRNAIAAALLSGVVGFILPANAAPNTDNSANKTSDYSAGSPKGTVGTGAKSETSEKATATEHKGTVQRAEAKHVVRHGTSTNHQTITSRREANEATADLNRQSLQSAQSGSAFTPNVASNENNSKATQVVARTHKAVSKKARSNVAKRAL
jgi:hypothetical protein